MKTVKDVKEALSYDTMIKVVYDYRKKQASKSKDNVVPFKKEK